MRRPGGFWPRLVLVVLISFAAGCASAALRSAAWSAGWWAGGVLAIVVTYIAMDILDRFIVEPAVRADRDRGVRQFDQAHLSALGFVSVEQAFMEAQAGRIARRHLARMVSREDAKYGPTARTEAERAFVDGLKAAQQFIETLAGGR